MTIPISTFTFVSKVSVIFGRAYHGNKHVVNQPLQRIFTSDDTRQNLLANNFQIATSNSNKKNYTTGNPPNLLTTSDNC